LRDWRRRRRRLRETGPKPPGQHKGLSLKRLFQQVTISSQGVGVTALT
jgi:hypothetical protein